MRTLLAIAAWLFTSAAFADAPQAYVDAGYRYQVPPDLVYAIAVTESSRPGYVHPWPWTANIAGRAYYFESRLELYETLKKHLERKEYNFDVGLMQINWRWNADLFGGDIWLATDPYANVDAGTKFLSELKEKHGSFNHAVAAYHVGSITTENKNVRALEYCARVKSNLPSSTDSEVVHE